MNKYLNAAKYVLEKGYDYVHYTEIIDIATKDGILITDGLTPGNTILAIIGTDIKTKGIKSKFLRIGDGMYALRKKTDEDNLLVFLKYRLKTDNLWLINEKDEKILLDIFGKDIFETGNTELIKLLNTLKDNGTVISYEPIGKDILINLKKDDFKISDELQKENQNLKQALNITTKWIKREVEEGVNNIAKKKIKKSVLDSQIKQLQKDAEKIKELSDNINKNLGLQELSQNFQKVGEDLKNILPQIFSNGLLETNNQTLSQFEQMSSALEGMYKNPVFENFGKIIIGVQESLKLYDISKLDTIKLEEFNNLKAQIGFFSQMITSPEKLFENFQAPPSIGNYISNDARAFISEPTKQEEIEESNLGFALPIKLGNNKLNFTHSFEGYLQEGDFTTIRGYTHIQDLSNISHAIYFNDGGVQRKEDEERCKKILNYIEFGNQRFFPEVVLGLYLKDDSIKIENSIKGDDRKTLSGLSKDIKNVKIDLNKLQKGSITRIDGNHRLFFGDKIKQDFLVPFCFVIFDQTKENDELKNIHKNQEANIFYLLNGKNKPVNSEEALQVLLNMPDEEAQSLYQNDSTLGWTRVCKQKYENFCNIGGSFKANFGVIPFTKFEKLIIQIEKLNLDSKEVDVLLDLIFETIHHLGNEYENIIKREDFLNLVLFLVLDNKKEDASKRNTILKKFFDWILREGLEDISFSEKPILWELKKKNKSFKETSDIHSYQINEYKYNGETSEIAYKEFIKHIFDSRIKIKDLNIDEKRIGLEKIVDAYSKLLDILGNPKNIESTKIDNAQRVSNITKRFFHSTAKPNMKKYLQDDFYDNLGKRVMNNDFALRHHETDKESLEDKQFIEFLYCEYDNAIRFILDKAGFLI